MSSIFSTISEVAPAAVLLTIYLVLLLAATALAFLIPPLRNSRARLALYCALRTFSLAVWLALATGAAPSLQLLSAAYSIFFSAFFLLLAAALPLFDRWMAVLTVATRADVAALALRLRGARVLALLAVVLMLVGGSQVLAGGGGAWSAPLSIAGAALLLFISALLLPSVLRQGLLSIEVARAEIQGGSGAVLYALLSRARAAAFALLGICLCTAVRAALAIASIVLPARLNVYAVVVAPELPAAVLMLLPPVAALFLYDDFAAPAAAPLPTAYASPPPGIHAVPAAAAAVVDAGIAYANVAPAMRNKERRSSRGVADA